MTATMGFRPFSNEHPRTVDVDVSSPSFWAQTFLERDQAFARLRAEAPVSWHPPFEDPMVPPELHGEKGFWAITKAADIRTVSLDNELFSSQTTVEQVTGPAGEAMRHYYHPLTLRPQHPNLDQPPTFLEMDPPRHTEYRRAISRAFTPRYVARMEEKIRQRAAEIVDRVVGMKDFDFVVEVSSQLPMLTIADMLGVPDELMEAFTLAGNNFNLVNSPDDLPPGTNPVEFAYAQIMTLREIGLDLVRQRRQDPREDVISSLATFTIDGEYLSDDDISSAMLLMSIAGNDTTKQTTSHTALALGRDPEQRAWLAADLAGRIDQAVEEFVRYACPVVEFGRMVTDDTELGGQRLQRGDKVMLFYCSGNRDEELFPDAHRFDVRRTTKGHVAFGGGGVHYCLGSSVAKSQLRAIFSQLITKLPNLELGEPHYLRNEFINGIRRLPANA